MTNKKNTGTASFDSGKGNTLKIKFKKVLETNTNLVVYGSGFLAPNTTSHNAGEAFKKVAIARDSINKSKFPKDKNEIYYCPTDIEFFEKINNSKKIKRLDIYCHGWLHGINLGGFEGKRMIGGVEMDGDKIDWMDKGENKGKDLRRVEIHEDLYLKSSQTTELTNLKANAFLNDTKVYFWGCNIGGQLNSKGLHIANNSPLIKDPKESFAQKFSEKIGKGNVYALVGKGVAAGSVFKQDSKGKNVYSDGEMLPANIAANAGYKNTIALKASDYMKKFPI
ncbi:hypothetical protein OAT18_00110 [Tenacibaculum sp.]|nr:hypothetical protein [Tenacibaculum sp.]